MQPRPLLSVRDLRVEFPTRRGLLTAVDGISFDVTAGEVLGIVGESGAGKSLTGAAIMRLLEPPGRIGGGEVWLTGERIDTLPPDALRRVRGRRIGMVFQDPLTSLNPLYTVGDQITETIRAHSDLSKAAARDKALALLNEVGIPAAAQRLDAYPHEFSGGMRQRVVISLALAADPELIIADEPTTALDVSVQAQVIAVLKRLCREKGTADHPDHPRHGRDCRDGRPGRGDVRRPHRRDRTGPRRDQVAAPSLYEGPDGLDPVASPVMRTRLEQIPGSMPRLNEIPPGCAFNPRCAHAFDRCRTERPVRRAIGTTEVACFWAGADADAGGAR